jgi:hypothetical protein
MGTTKVNNSEKFQSTDGNGSRWGIRGAWYETISNDGRRYEGVTSQEVDCNILGLYLEELDHADNRSKENLRYIPTCW